MVHKSISVYYAQSSYKYDYQEI